MSRRVGMRFRIRHSSVVHQIEANKSGAGLINASPLSSISSLRTSYPGTSGIHI